MKKIDYSTYKRPTDFMKFAQGLNTIRIVSTGVIGYQHGMRTAKGYVNLGLCTENDNCELCAKGNEPKRVWKWLAYDYSDNSVKIIDAGPTLGNQICEIAAKAGDPQEYDLVVKRTGEKLKTEYETTKAKENKEIAPADRLVMEFRKKRLLAKYFTVKKRYEE